MEKKPGNMGNKEKFLGSKETMENLGTKETNEISGNAIEYRSNVKNSRINSKNKKSVICL